MQSGSAGQSPLQLARAAGHEAIERMLEVGYKAIEHTAAPKALHSAVTSAVGSRDVGRLAWEGRVDLNSVGVMSRVSRMHMSRFYMRPYSLLTTGKIVQVPALHAAVRAGQLVACAFLLEARWRPMCADCNQHSALHTSRTALRKHQIDR